VTLGVHFVTNVAFAVRVMFATDCFHIVRIREQVRPLSWRYAMVDSVSEVLATLAVNDALALRIQSDKPSTELSPTRGQIHHPHWVRLLGFVLSLLALLCVLWAVAAGLDECWASNLPACPERS
jgi:protein-S-isoprenylcysteine O-methyltransferase Ste14